MTIFIEGNSTSLSYASIFDNLWRQAELYDEIKKAYEKFQSHDKIQKEFTEITDHELREPIQPILGFTKYLKNKITDKGQIDLLEIIDRNTRRLKKLSENILELSKIENNLLSMHKEQFNMKELIQNLTINYKNENIEIRSLV